MKNKNMNCFSANRPINIFRSKVSKIIGQSILLLMVLFISVACENGRDIEESLVLKDQELMVLDGELTQVKDMNDALKLKINELETQQEALLASEAQLEMDLENLSVEYETYKKETLTNIQNYKAYNDYFKYKYYEIIDYDGPVYALPSEASEVVLNDQVRAFIKAEVIGEDGNKWYQTELLYTMDTDIISGYINTSNSLMTPVDMPFIENKDVRVNNHYIGEDISVFDEITSPLPQVNKGELSWYVNDGDVIYGFNPINWKINSFNIIGEGKILDDRFGVGDNAEEAIDYYTDKYDMLYLGDYMSEMSDNIIKLSDGYLLIIRYNTGILTSESLITEIKIFNEADMP